MLSRLREVVEQLRIRELVDPIIEVGADLADGAGVGVDGFRLQALEPKVLEVGLVVAIELGVGWGWHVSVTS